MLIHRVFHGAPFNSLDCIPIVSSKHYMDEAEGTFNSLDCIHWCPPELKGLERGHTFNSLDCIHTFNRVKVIAPVGDLSIL